MNPPSQKESDAMMRQWAKTRGLKEYTGYAYSGLRFLDHSMPKEFQYNGFPAGDHVTYWNKGGRPYCIVSQPYHIDSVEMAQIVRLANEWSLNVSVSAAPAWHYPGSVIHMEWTVADFKPL